MTIVILWCEVLLFDADDVMIITKSHMKSVTKVKFVIMFDPAAHEVAERARSRSLRVRPTGRPNWSTG